MAATSIDVLLTEMLELLLVRFREYLRLQHESAVIKLELQHSLLLHLSLSLQELWLRRSALFAPSHPTLCLDQNPAHGHSTMNWYSATRPVEEILHQIRGT